MTCYEDLVWRGLIKDISSPELIQKLNEGGMTFYIGTDPTGDSLHIGHYSSFLICNRLASYGHHPICLVGGGTGLIGDPRPTSERPMITYEEVNKNFECLSKQVKKLFKCEKVVNNYDWLSKISFIDYLRDYGKYFNINYMLDKDIIKRRLDEGITYTEFSYMIMQAMDFCHLCLNEGVTLQAAGQDQWGNITAGIELARKKYNKELYGFTMPLVTKKDGTKFGKSEGHAFWLDANKTTPYEMYQFLVNSEDEMVIQYLKQLTLLSREEIEDIEKENNKTPEKRIAAKRLAYEVVKFLHGEEEAKKAEETSEAVFSGKVSENMPTVELNHFEGNILDLIVATELAPSKSEARRLVVQGGISIDSEKITDPNMIIENHEFVLQKGKKKIIRVLIKD